MTRNYDKHDLFEYCTVEEIREKLKTFPLEDPQVVIECQFTGSGMTEHGFMIGSGDVYNYVPDPDRPGCFRMTLCKDEAEEIFNSVTRWDRNGRRRKNCHLVKGVKLKLKPTVKK